MFGLLRGHSTNFTIFLMTSLFFISIGGANFSMHTTADGEISWCYFMQDQKSLCQMNILEHLSLWHHTFLALTIKTGIVAVFLLSAVFFSSLTIAKTFVMYDKLKIKAQQLFVCRKSSTIKTLNPLLIAFSDGILNSKVY